MIKIRNDEHIELLKIQTPGLETDFFGVVKLCIFDKNSFIQTKCLKVNNTSTVKEVLEIFLAKIEPQKVARNYSIYAVYSNGEYKLLSKKEPVLLIQLSWVDNEIDGRFLVRENTINPNILVSSTLTENSKANCQQPTQITKPIISFPHKEDNMNQIIKDLYEKTPWNVAKTNIMIKCHTKQKFEAKIRELMNEEMHRETLILQNDENNQKNLESLEINIRSIDPKSSYIAVIASIYDNARIVIKELLTKLAINNIHLNETNLFLTMGIISKKDYEKCGKLLKKTPKEYCILDDDYPLILQKKYSSEDCFVYFHLRKRKCEISVINHQLSEAANKFMLDKTHLSIMCELNTLQSEKSSDHPSYIILNNDILAIGSNTYNLTETKILGKKPDNILKLKHLSILPIHCVIFSLNGVLSIFPTLIESVVKIDGNRIYDVTPLLNGTIVIIGSAYFFKVLIPSKIVQLDSSIYWKRLHSDTLSQRTTTQQKTELTTDGEIFKKLPQIMLPLYLKFEKVHFEIIFNQIFKKLFDTESDLRLSPAYFLYLLFISQYDNYINENDNVNIFENSIALKKDFHNFCKTCYKIVDESIIYNTNDIEILLMWLGNISEFLNFIKNDIFLYLITEEVQNFCRHCIRVLINEIIRKIEGNLENDIQAFYIPFINDRDLSEDLNLLINFDPTVCIQAINKKVCYNWRLKTINPDLILNVKRSSTILDIISCFNELLFLFNQYKINSSFILQIMQSIFYYICKCVMDEIIFKIEYKWFIEVNLGETLKTKLNHIYLWGRSHGIEVIVLKSFHPLLKLLDFFETKKKNFAKIKAVFGVSNSSTQIKMEELLNIWTFSNKPKITHSWKNSSIEHSHSIDGKKNKLSKNIRLEFQYLFHNSCFITKDGYTSENPQEIANQLYELIKNLKIPQIGVIMSQDNRLYWDCRFKNKIYNYKFTDNKTEYMHISVEKEEGQYWGMRIILIRNNLNGNEGIYVNKILQNSVIEKDGRIDKGDQLISINGISLIGVKESKASEIITSCGNILRIEVLKNSALLNGVEQYLNERQPVDNNSTNSVTENESQTKYENLILKIKNEKKTTLTSLSDISKIKSHKKDQTLIRNNTVHLPNSSDSNNLTKSTDPSLIKK